MAYNQRHSGKQHAAAGTQGGNTEAHRKQKERPDREPAKEETNRKPDAEGTENQRGRRQNDCKQPAEPCQNERMQAG